MPGPDEQDRSLTRLSTLLALTDRLNALADPADILRLLVDEGFAVYGPIAGGLALLREDGRLEVTTMKGYPPELSAQLVGALVASNSPMWDAVRSGEPVWLDTAEELLARYPQLTPIHERLDHSATVALPLRSAERVLGAVGFHYPPRAVPDAEERHYAILLAERLASAIERSQLLSNLRRSEERYRSLVEASTQVVWRADGEGLLDNSRARWSALSGFDLAELPEELLDLVHPEDREQGNTVWWQSVEHRQALSFEQRVRRRGGGYRHWHVRAAPVLEPDGRVREWIGTDSDITERKRSEEALRESQHFLERLTETIPTVIYVYDLDEDRNVYANRQLAEALGYTPEEAQTLGPSFLPTMMHPDDWAVTPAFIARLLALRDGEMLEREYRIRHRGGEWRWFFGREMVFARAPGGRPAQVLGSILDITERKAAEEALRRQSELTNTSLENSTACMFMMDERGYCTYMNRAGEQMFGWSFEEIRQRPLHDLIHHHHPDGRPYPMAECPIDRALPENFDIREHADVFIRRSGEFFPVLVAASPIFDAGGRPVSTVIEVRDMSEARRAEAATARRSEQLRRLAQAATRIHGAQNVAAVMGVVTEEARTLIGAHQAVTSTTTDQNWAQALNEIALSETYARWRGYDTLPDGSGIYALVCQTNTPMRLTQAELEAHPAWRGFGAESDQHPPMRGWLAVPLVGLDGRNIGLIQLSDKEEGDFTADDEAMLVQLAQMASIALENQQLYEQEQRARTQAEEANRLKDEFLATVSHELRTPLTAFLGYAQLLQARKRDEAYIARTVEKLVRSAKMQAQLIEDLLDVSRVVSGKLRLDPQPTDLIAVVQAAVDTVRPALEAKSIQLLTELRPDATAVIGDAGRLQQVLWNLLSNAVKFTQPGGTIRVRLVPRGADALLTVSDTGQGISASFLPYVFEHFRQADGTNHRVHGGLGLGLAIVRHLVELHGGTVEAASEGEGRGTTFSIRLPLAALGDAPPETEM
ncbi:MAG: hypothetical protein RLZZ387_639 [Chloroflexota bacterium]